MASPKVRYEQLALLNAIETHFGTLSYTGFTFNSGFQTDKTITNPQISLTFLPSEGRTLQLGKITGKDRLFGRRIQVDSYMENEPRSQTVVDDLMDFFLDDLCVFILDPAGNELGYMITTSDEGVSGQVLPPNLTQPKLIRWRGIVRAELESFYPG